MATAIESPLTPDRRRELTRQALVDAATVVFARRGFRGASLDEVAETAGFTKGAIYSNFAGKEDLFFAVVERRDQERLAEFSVLLDSATGKDLPGLLAGVAEALTVGLRERDWVLLETEMWLYAQRDTRALDRLTAYQRTHLANVTGFVVSAAAAAGVELRIPPQELAALMVAATTGIAQLRHADPEAGHERLYGLLLRMLTDAVVTPSE